MRVLSYGDGRVVYSRFEVPDELTRDDQQWVAKHLELTGVKPYRPLTDALIPFGISMRDLMGQS